MPGYISVVYLSLLWVQLDHGVLEQPHSASNMGMAVFSVGRRLARSLPVDFNSLQYASSLSDSPPRICGLYFTPGPLCIYVLKNK